LGKKIALNYITKLKEKPPKKEEKKRKKKHQPWVLGKIPQNLYLIHR
jgi:hypothetical protein